LACSPPSLAGLVSLASSGPDRGRHRGRFEPRREPSVRAGLAVERSPVDHGLRARSEVERPIRVLVLRSVVPGLVAFRDTHIHLDLDGRVAESVSGGREPEFEQDRRSVAAVSVVTVPSDSMVRVSVGTTSIRSPRAT